MNEDLAKIRSYTETMCELRLIRLQEDLRQFDIARKHLEDMIESAKQTLAQVKAIASTKQD
jgi:hypothetical protein